MNRTTLLALLAVTLHSAVAANAARAAIVYAADFNSAAAGHTGDFVTSGNYADGNLNTQNTWVNSSGLGTNNLTVANSATNGFVAMASSGDDERAAFTSVPSAAGTSIWLSADITVSAAQTAGDYFLNLGDGTATVFTNKVHIKSATLPSGGAGFVLGTSVSANTAAAGTVFGTTVLTFGQKYHIVSQYDFVAGSANDTTALYVDPVDPIFGGGTAYALGPIGGSDATAMAAVYLRQGTAANAATLASVDNIAVAITVPEPATAVLFAAVAACFGVGYRRRA